MLALLLALGLSTLPAPIEPPLPIVPVWATGRLVTRPRLHVGVRPAAFATNDGPELAAGVTVQVRLPLP